MLTYLWVAIGGALGSMARYWLAGLVADILGPEFPWGTILINIAGSFIIGAAALLLSMQRHALGFDSRAFVMVGLCGGFTTFSAFSLQTLELARLGRWFEAGANVVGSVVLCLLAVWAGHALAASLSEVVE